ncbi:MAG: signal transduction histidine kinase [Flammeovirgaceae bacterium]|jgi:signal transduction histidine kinase
MTKSTLGEKQKYHKILQRQIKKILGRNAEVSPDMNALLEFVSETYQHYDDDRYMLERSIELSSKELVENNQGLKLQKQELENTLEELLSTQQQLEESEKLAKVSQMLSESNDQLLQQQEETRAAYEELQSVHEDLQSTQTQLIQSEKMSSLGQLTAGVAHEINNPVNFVYAGVQALDYTLKDLFAILAEYQKVIRESLEESEDNNLNKNLRDLIDQDELEELKEGAIQMIEDIKIGAERTAEIVRGLRNFSRSDGTTWQQTDLHEGLDSTLVILNSQLKSKNIEVIKEYSHYVETIQCYAGPLNQVFMNIISNSIHAIEGKGTISIHTKDLKSAIEISIKDSGKGMTEEVKNKVFDPFFTTKAIGSGTGLGLSISYGIIEKHQGSIEVESQEGKGTTFTITILKLSEEPK